MEKYVPIQRNDDGSISPENQYVLKDLIVCIKSEFIKCCFSNNIVDVFWYLEQD